MKINSNFSTYLFVGVVFFVLVASLAYACAPTMNRVQWEEEYHIVEKGETLWEIGSRCCPDSVDIREWIEEVQEINNLCDRHIRAGERIVVLVPVNAD